MDEIPYKSPREPSSGEMPRRGFGLTVVEWIVVLFIVLAYVVLFLLPDVDDSVQAIKARGTGIEPNGTTGLPACELTVD